jgi:hypothetical protein
VTHLSSEQIVLYRRARLAGAELLAADDHVAGCEECRAKLAGDSEARLASIAQALQSADAIDDHLTYDQLRAYVDRDAKAEEAADIESHLRACALCRAEVDDLRRFSEQIKGPVKRPASFPRWLIMGAIAAALVAGMFLVRTRPARNTAESAPAPAIPLVVSLHDGGSVLGLDNQGHLSAPANLSSTDRDSIAAALRDGALPVFVDDRLRSNRSTLLGGGGKDTQFRVVSPVGQMVLSERPEFRWQPLAGAKSYRVEVFDANYTPAMSSPATAGTSWTPESAFARGKLYVWQVTALGLDETAKAPQPPDPEARFEIVDEAKAAAIEQARASSSHLLLASRYAAAGLCTEAMGEIAALDAANPGSSLVSRMRGRLSSQCSEKSSEKNPVR